MKALLLLCGLCFGALGALACAGGEVPTEIRRQQFEAGAAPKLVVRSQSGSVSVRAGAEGMLGLEALLRDPSRVRFETRLEGDTLFIDVEVAGTSLTDVATFRVTRGADITLTAPPATAVSIETLTGGIALHGLTAGGRGRTGNGKLVLQGLRGHYAFETARGDIEGAALDGSFQLRTASGQVSLTDVRGEFAASTSYGRLTFSGSLAAGGRSILESGDGRVIVQLRQAGGTSLSVSGGGVRVTGPPTLVATVSSNNRFEGSLGAGDTTLTVRATNGSVDVTLTE